MKEFTGHISHSGIKGNIVELHCIKPLRHCQEEEESAFRVSPSHILRHMLLKEREKEVAFSFIKGYTLLQVIVQSAGSQELSRHILVKDRRTQIQRLFADIYLVQNIRMRYGPAQTESRGEYL